MKHSHLRHSHIKVPGRSCVENRAQRNLSNWQHNAEPEYEGISGMIGVGVYSAFFGSLGICGALLAWLSFQCSQAILGIFLGILSAGSLGLVAFNLFALFVSFLRSI